MTLYKNLNVVAEIFLIQYEIQTNGRKSSSLFMRYLKAKSL